jgi:membrane protein DedA with SNARE-associated domain
VSLPAGARRVPLIPFVALTTIGCAIWAVLFVLAGALSGTAWSTVNSVLGKALLAALALFVGAAVARRRRRGADGESAAAVSDDQVGDHADHEPDGHHQ